MSCNNLSVKNIFQYWMERSIVAYVHQNVKKKCIIPDPNKALELSLVELSLVVRFAFQEFFEEKLFNQACCFYSLKQSLT